MRTKIPGLRLRGSKAYNKGCRGRSTLAISSDLLIQERAEDQTTNTRAIYVEENCLCFTGPHRVFDSLNIAAKHRILGMGVSTGGWPLGRR